MPLRRRIIGSAVAISTMALFVAVMLPLRSHLSAAVIPLLLLVPVVVAASIGGFVAGLVTVVVGFLSYDLFFIRPYYSLTVGSASSWGALVVYFVVMLLVSRVVDRLWHTEATATEASRDTTHLFELSELLVGDRPATELFEIVVGSVRTAFGFDAVVLLLPEGRGERSLGESSGRLEVVAAAGRDASAEELAEIVPSSGETSRLRSSRPGAGGAPARQGRPTEIETVVLDVEGRTVGLLGVIGPGLARRRRELLRAYGNHIAAAIERSTLQDQAVRVKLLEGVDRHRRYLFGAVSHDLRTPLSAIKASASALGDPTMGLSPGDRTELAWLIEAQADRLERVVSNLMDMSRIQAGALVLERESVSLEDLFAEVLRATGSSRGRVIVSGDDVAAPITGDQTLLVEALVNLVENALRYAPADKPVELAANLSGPEREDLTLTVTDGGPGIPAGERARLFGRLEPGGEASPRGGSGLGLSIARAFVEAHGGTIAIEDALPGTRVVIVLPGAARPMRAAAGELSETT